jgi:hypothetical protein
MADIYLKSTTGADGNTGLTNWGNAKATLAAALTAAGAGGRVFMSQAHTETYSANTTLPGGSVSSPISVICCDDSAAPPTAVATTGAITNTGAFSLVTGNNVNYYGVNFKAGSGGSNGFISLANTNTPVGLFESCSFDLSGGGNASAVNATSSGSVFTSITWINCTITFGNVAQTINVSGCRFRWRGGSVLAGSPTINVTALITSQGTGLGTAILLEDLDLSSMGTTSPIFTNVATCVTSIARNIKMGASQTLLKSGSTISNLNSRMSGYNIDSGATNYKLKIEDWAGTITSETTFVRTGGASDGTTTLAWKMVSNTKPVPGDSITALETDEMVVWNDTTGSAITVTVEILRDSATALKDDEIWLEGHYASSGSDPQYAFATDERADPLATTANQASSSASWITTGMANPNTQALSITFTPQAKGYVYLKVCLAKTSTTVYVDPYPVVT